MIIALTREVSSCAAHALTLLGLQSLNLVASIGYWVVTVRTGQNYFAEIRELDSATCLTLVCECELRIAVFTPNCEIPVVSFPVENLQHATEVYIPLGIS